MINEGAYGPIKNMLKRVVTDDRQPSVKFVRNITAGCLSGTIAAVASNPVDLCKTKLQAKNTPYTSSMHVIKDVIQQHGVKGLWVGTVPAAIRTGIETKNLKILLSSNICSRFNSDTMCHI